MTTDGHSFMVGESLVGDGNEVAHIDLIIGSKSGPAGAGFAQRLAAQTAGHNGLLAVLAPNVPAKPDTVMFNKVTIKGAGQAVQMFGPAQAAVAKAVVDSVADGTIPKANANDLCVIVGVFIHWEATDNKKIYDYNYRATKESIAAGDEAPADRGFRRRPEGLGQAPLRLRRGRLVAARGRATSRPSFSTGPRGGARGPRRVSVGDDPPSGMLFIALGTRIVPPPGRRGGGHRHAGGGDTIEPQNDPIDAESRRALNAARRAGRPRGLTSRHAPRQRGGDRGHVRRGVQDARRPRHRDRRDRRLGAHSGRAGDRLRDLGDRVRRRGRPGGRGAGGRDARRPAGREPARLRLQRRRRSARPSSTASASAS